MTALKIFVWLWLAVFIVFALNARLAIIGRFAGICARLWRWVPVGRQIEIRIAECSPRVEPASRKWRGVVTAVTTFADSEKSGRNAGALVTLSAPIIVDGETLEGICIVPRHRGYDMGALWFAGIGVNVHRVSTNGPQIGVGEQLASGWLRLQRLSGA